MTALRMAPLIRARRLGRRVGLRGAAVLAAVLLLLGGLWLWLRDSPLVSIDRVTVTGAAGPDAGVIRAALITAAHGMTTLNVSLTQLRTAVSPYPEVKSLHVSTQLPHGLRIRVIEELAVAQVELGDRRVAVAADGTLLHPVTRAKLPKIPLPVPPGGPRLTEPAALAAVRALGAAPYQLLPRISQVEVAANATHPHGVVAQLRNGPAIYLGDGSELRAKWMAALAVLANSGSNGASYIDVTDPARPVAGGA